MTETEEKKVLLLRRSNGKLQSAIQPILINYKKRGKKKGRADGTDGKNKYTAGLEDIQRLEENVVRVAQRSTKTLSKGIDTYEQERNRSAKAKKNGAIEDFVQNTAKAASASMKEASGIPIDIADWVNTKSYRKRVRESLRQASRIIRLFRI